MARIRYTVTFPAARPGDEVTWPNTVKVYPDANTPVPLQSGQTLNESLAFSGWSESASIVFTRPAGDNDTVTVTSGAPSRAGAAAPSAAGGSAPVRAVYYGADNGNGLVHGDYTQLQWAGTLHKGTQLFDVTDPAAPTALVAGYYTVSGIAFGVPAADSAGYLFTEVDWDLNNASADGTQSTYTTVPIGAASPGMGFDAPIFGEWFLGVGEALGVAVKHTDSTHTINVSTTVNVVFRAASA